MLNYLASLLVGLGVFNEEQLRNDDKITSILDRELDYVQRQAYEVVYPQFKARQLIPVSNEADPAAETITYKMWDGFGIAKMLSDGYGDDIPLVDALAEEFTVKIKGMGLGYQYSIMDLKRSATSGAKLDSRRAKQTRKGIETKIENIGATGDAPTGLLGMANNPNVTVVSPITGTWASASGIQMVNDLLHVESEMVRLNQEAWLPTTIALDLTQHALLRKTIVSTTGDTNTTALKMFLDTAAYVKEVVPWNRLSTADAGGTGPRIACYAKDPDVLSLEIPQEYEQLPPQPKNMTFFVPAHARCGGVLMHYPLGMVYMDGC